MVARAEWVDAVLVEELSQVAQEPEMRRHLQAELERATDVQDAALHQEAGQFRLKLLQIEEQSDRWADAYSRGVLQEKKFVQYSQKLETEEEALTIRLEQVQKDLQRRSQREEWMQQVQQTLLDFSLVWENLDNDERRQLHLVLLEDKGLRIDRHGRDIIIKIKVHLLPERERTIMYRYYRGSKRGKLTGEQRLTRTQMTVLYYAVQGKTRKEAAALMNCRYESVYSAEKTVCKNLGNVTLAEAIEMTRERVASHAAQLTFHQPRRSSKSEAIQGAFVDSAIAHEQAARPFLTAVLLEAFVLFAQGATTVEVAQELSKMPHTIQARRARILKAFGTKSMLEAVRAAKETVILPA